MLRRALAAERSTARRQEKEDAITPKRPWRPTSKRRRRLTLESGNCTLRADQSRRNVAADRIVLQERDVRMSRIGR